MLKKIFLSSAVLLLMSSCGPSDYTSSKTMITTSKTTVIDYKKEMQSNFDTTFFMFDNSEISKDAKNKLDVQVDSLTKHSDTNIKIVGFCDERGTKEYNIALGERRANAVKDYLVKKGISSSRITVESVGKEILRCDTRNPIYDVTKGNRDIYHQQNRHALIINADSKMTRSELVESEQKRCLHPNQSVFTKPFQEEVTSHTPSTSKTPEVSKIEEEEEQYLPIATEVCDRQ